MRTILRIRHARFWVFVLVFSLEIPALQVWAGSQTPLHIRVPLERTAPPIQSAGTFSVDIWRGAETESQGPALRVLVGDVAVPLVEIRPVPVQRPLVAIIDLSPPVPFELQEMEDGMLKVSRRLAGSGRALELVATFWREYRSIEPRALGPTVAEFQSRHLVATAGQENWERMEGVRGAVEHLLEQYSVFDVVIFTRDFAGSLEETDAPFRPLANGLAGLLSSHGISLDIAAHESPPGIFSTVAELTGGHSLTIGEHDSLEALLEGIPTETPPGCVLSLDGSGLRPAPYLLPVRVVSSQPDAGFEWEGHLWSAPEELEHLTLEGLRHVDALRLRRELLAEKQRWWDAIDAAEKVVRLSPLTLPDRLRLADLRVAFGQSTEAVRILSQARELFVHAWEIPYRLGLIYKRDDSVEQAAHFFEEALHLRSRERSVPERLAGFHTATGPFDKPVSDAGWAALDGPEIRLELAESLLKSGRLEEAEREVEGFLSTKPDDIAAQALLIQVLRDEKQHEKAFSRALSLLEQDPGNPDGLAGAGLSLQDLDRSEEAIPYLSRAISEHPLDSDLHLALYRCQRSLGHWSEALDSIRTARHLLPGRPDLTLNEEEILEQRGDLAAAGRLLKEEAPRVESDFQLWDRLGRWHERRGDLKAAIAAYQKAASLSTVDRMPEMSRRLGVLRLIADGATGESLKDFENAGIPDLSEIREIVQSSKHATESSGAELQGVVFPGGRKALLRFAPFLEQRAETEDLLALLFQYLLEVKGVPRRTELIKFLKEYSRFQTWLRSNDLFAQEFSVQLIPEKADIEKANRILSYFGARARFDWRDPEKVVSVEIEDEGKHRERSIVLQLMGLNLGLLQRGSSLHFQFEEDVFPVPEGLDFLASAVGRMPGEEDFLAHWLEKPETMRLYIALSQLPLAAQRRMRLFRPADFITDLLPGLWSYGALLKFDTEGLLALPGGPGKASLWADLVGHTTRNDKTFLPKLFSKDNGKALYYAAVLSQAPPEVCDYVMSGSERFERFYNRICDVGHMIGESNGLRQYHDLGDLLLLLELRGGTIDFPGTKRIWEISERYPEGRGLDDMDSLMIRDGGSIDRERLLYSLLDTSQLGAAAAGVRKYAVVKYLAGHSPYLLDEQVGPALALSFDRLGGLFELVSDLDLGATLAVTLLKTADSLDHASDGNRRRTSIALFQAPLVLIQSLVRKGVLEKDRGRELVREFLALSFSDDQPGRQAQQVAGFLTTRLKPEIHDETPVEGASPGGWLLHSLAGSGEEAVLFLDNEAYTIGLKDREVKRLERAFENQKLSPLDAILEAFSWLSKLEEHPGASYDSLKQICSLLREPDGSEWTDDYRKAVVHTRRKELMSQLEDLRGQISGNEEGVLDVLSAGLADQLAPFLADTLVGLVYCADVHWEDFFTRIEDSFSRKHAFTRRFQRFGIRGPRPVGGSWGQPILVETSDEVGSRIEGSLVGISIPLTRLKTLGMTLESGRVVSLDFPDAQLLAIELVNPSELTDEVVSYAGELIDMARYLVAAAAVDPGIRTHCENFVLRYCGSRRADTFIRLLRTLQIDQAVALLLPSERFLLAETYYRDQALASASVWYFHNS